MFSFFRLHGFGFTTEDTEGTENIFLFNILMKEEIKTLCSLCPLW